MKTTASFILFCLGIAAAAPSDGQEGPFPTPSAKTLGHGRLLAGLSVFGHNDADAVKDKTFLFPGAGPGIIDTVLYQDLVSIGARPALGFGIGNYFDATLSIPLYADLLTESGVKDLSGMAQGDVKVTVKIGAPFHTEVAAVAVVLEATAPTGVTKGFLPKGSELTRPVDSLNGLFENEVTFSAKKSVQAGWGLFTLDLTKLDESIPIRFGLGLGYLMNPGSIGGPRAQGSASFEWIPVPRFGLFTMLATQASVNRFQGFGDFNEEDMRLTTGLAVRSEEGLFVDASVQFRLSGENHVPYTKSDPGGAVKYEALAIPGLQLGIRFGWTGTLFQTDKDGDGIPDKVDACPKEKEDIDGFQDADGCPESDNDDDSIRDVQDKCPLQSEDFDNIQDEDGCPETDADQDGVNDEDDRCPSESEDRDGFSDMDGCPDLDNDQDNVLDAQDRCPMQPEDKDEFQDADGCPDPDNDMDGILDSLDKCSDQPENRNGVEDSDGCPEASLPAPTVEISHHGVLSEVQFQGQSAVLTPGSYQVLDSLAGRLKIMTRARLEIRVYTDDKGTSREQLKVTQARADAVVKHLSLKGVERTRLTARGMGSKSPLASNRTPQGRQQNRRVEFQRVD